MSHRQRALKMLGVLAVLGVLHAVLLWTVAATGLVSKVIGGGSQVGYGAALLVTSFAIVRTLWLLLGPGVALLALGYGVLALADGRGSAPTGPGR